MQYSISEIAKIIGADSLLPAPDSRISRLLTDSRSLTYPSDTLFLPLKHLSGDGHRYVKSLYDRGVRSFVVSGSFSCSDDLQDANILYVESPLAALQTRPRIIAGVTMCL